MQEVTAKDFFSFSKSHSKVVFSDRIGKKEIQIKIGQPHKLKKNLQPKDFTLQAFTTWSFPKRGNWATHKGNYRGNWAPEIPRNLILRYSQPEDTVLDQMCGSGTTLVECKLTGRNGIGVDINKNAVMIARDRLNFDYNTIDGSVKKTTQKTYVGDARFLDKIKTGSVDLIATHPPYANIIPYSKERLEGDLSNTHSIAEFAKEMKEVAMECYRVLKPNHFCAILMGDTRRNLHYIPVAFRTLNSFLEVEFILREDIIKHQWQCKSTPYWVKKSMESNFLMIMHEHLFVFRKPGEGEKVKKFKESMFSTNGE
jgi:DNA modification methylase